MTRKKRKNKQIGPRWDSIEEKELRELAAANGRTPTDLIRVMVRKAHRDWKANPETRINL